MSWDVRVLKLGQAEVPVPQVLFLTGFDQWCVLNFYMVVATQGDKVAIVNCGMPDDLTDINKFWEVSFGDPTGSGPRSSGPRRSALSTPWHRSASSPRMSTT